MIHQLIDVSNSKPIKPFDCVPLDSLLTDIESLVGCPEFTRIRHTLPHSLPESTSGIHGHALQDLTYMMRFISTLDEARDSARKVAVALASEIHKELLKSEHSDLFLSGSSRTRVTVRKNALAVETCVSRTLPFGSALAEEPLLKLPEDIGIRNAMIQQTQDPHLPIPYDRDERETQDTGGRRQLVPELEVRKTRPRRREKLPPSSEDIEWERQEADDAKHKRPRSSFFPKKIIVEDIQRYGPIQKKKSNDSANNKKRKAVVDEEKDWFDNDFERDLLLFAGPDESIKSTKSNNNIQYNTTIRKQSLPLRRGSIRM